MSLADFGFSPFFARALEKAEPGTEAARVLVGRGESYRVVGQRGEEDTSVSGRLRHSAASSAGLPAVGDWVGLLNGRIDCVLPRRNALSRKVPGRRTVEQIVAANVDTVIVVMGLDGDFNYRRLERYLAAIWESGAQPAVLLNKIDLNLDFETRQWEIEALAPAVPVIAASCTEGVGLAEVRGLLHPRKTTVLVGSSGAGKSTLINRLLGEERQTTLEVSPRDARGRHATTHRELFAVPGAGLLIDNPGIRELQLWAGEETLDRTFEDIARLAEDCRYRDCAHRDEPGCAVRAAVETGELDPERLESLRALEKELRYLETRQDASARAAEKRKWRAIHRGMRKAARHRGT